MIARSRVPLTIILVALLAVLGCSAAGDSGMTDYTRDDGGSEGATDGDDTGGGGDADVEAGEGSETGDDVPDGESGGDADVDPDGADDGAPVACTS